MKNTLFTTVCTFFIVYLIFGCQDLKIDIPQVNTSVTDNLTTPISIEEAKDIINTKGSYGKKPIWELAESITKNNITYIQVPVTVENNLIPAIPDNKSQVNNLIHRFSQNELTHLFFYKDKKV
ncbi:hypothetical protein [Spirosoma koreense]